jgi:hypothetical protein
MQITESHVVIPVSLFNQMAAAFYGVKAKEQEYLRLQAEREEQARRLAADATPTTESTELPTKGVEGPTFGLGRFVPRGAALPPSPSPAQETPPST